MDKWAKIMVVGPEFGFPEPIQVNDAGGTLEPEEWASVWGVRNYPNAIYFFADEDEF